MREEEGGGKMREVEMEGGGVMREEEGWRREVVGNSY